MRRLRPTIPPPRARRPPLAAAALAVLVASGTACERCDGPSRETSPRATGEAERVRPEGDASVASAALRDAAAAEEAWSPPPDLEEAPLCPPDMVRVARTYCVDRFEASLVDHKTGGDLSPYYPPSHRLALSIEKVWRTERFQMGPLEKQAVPLPELPQLLRAGPVEPRALSRRGAVPSGYLTGELAETACRNADKRLCTLDEWRTACRGEQDRPYPYGERYRAGRCNIFREAHPAQILHGNASIGHADPRLNLVEHAGAPLLRRTGDTPSCRSEWEGDAIYDMVGNLDEWIDDREGTFVGGFYARNRTDGCQAAVTSHEFHYFDYSLGVRCCRDLTVP